MTLEEARAVLLSFAGAKEGEHHGHPDFRVGGKIFATLQPAKGLAVFRLPMEMAEALAGRPEHQLVSRFGGLGWLAVELENFGSENFALLAHAAFERRVPTR